MLVDFRKAVAPFSQDMTYVKQLEDYEEAVMARRLAEMTPDELDRMMIEVRAIYRPPTLCRPVFPAEQLTKKVLKKC